LAGLRTLLKQDENVKLIAISVDPPDVSKNFAEKIASDGKGRVNFPILSDPDHKIIDSYGLRDPGIARPLRVRRRRAITGQAAWAGRRHRFVSQTRRL